MTPAWLAIRFPDLALDAARRGAEPDPAPCAVIDRDAAIPRVVAACAAAMKAGVRPGLSQAAARALCPGLRALPRDTDAERVLRELLGEWAYGFSDAVSLALHDAVVLEIGASLTLFGGWPVVERRLRAELAALGVRGTLAVAPTPRAAWLFSALEDGLVLDHPVPFQRALLQLPLAALDIDPERREALHGMGFRRLRDLRALPRAALARRAGQPLVDALDRLFGESADVLPRYRPPTRYAAGLVFDGRVESIEGLRFPLRRLIDDLARTLARRDGGVAGFEITLEHDALPPTQVAVGLVEPERDAGRLLELAFTRMERVTLPAPVAGLRLAAEALPPFAPPECDLFERARQGGLDWGQLVERLRARLGDGAVRTLSLVADHRPRASQRVRPLDMSSRTANGATPTMAARAPKVAANAPKPPTEAIPTTPRPLWLLERPIPLRSPPRELLAGPERIESGWWDGADLRRDFYLARLADGAHAWISAAAGERDGFMLEGFAG